MMRLFPSLRPAGLLLVTGALSVSASGVLAQSTGAGPSWLSNFDQQRLADHDRYRNIAREKARLARSSKPADVALFLRLSAAGSRRLNQAALPGQYRCRTIKAGGSMTLVIAYGWFRCRIQRAGRALRFVKLSGSQRTSGVLVPASARRMIYAGAGHIGGDQPNAYTRRAPAPGASCNEYRNEVAYLRRIGPRRYVMGFPRPLCEADYNIIELRKIR